MLGWILNNICDTDRKQRRLPVLSPRQINPSVSFRARRSLPGHITQHLHFCDEDSAGHRGSLICGKSGKWQGWDWNSSLLIPSPGADYITQPKYGASVALGEANTNAEQRVCSLHKPFVYIKCCHLFTVYKTVLWGAWWWIAWCDCSRRAPALTLGIMYIQQQLCININKKDIYDRWGV